MPKPKQKLNREGWLTELARMVEPIFKGFKIAPYRLTCSWPSREAMPGKRGVRLGECHGDKSSKGGIFELFISPLLHTSMGAAATVCHELAHVVAGVDAQHGPRYKMICHHAGITKNKPRQAEPGPALQKELKEMIAALGEYPHHGMQLQPKKIKTPSSASLVCPCGCKVTISLKWLGASGFPKCGCGNLFKLKDAKKDEDEG